MSVDVATFAAARFVYSEVPPVRQHGMRYGVGGVAAATLGTVPKRVMRRPGATGAHKLQVPIAVTRAVAFLPPEQRPGLLALAHPDLPGGVLADKDFHEVAHALYLFTNPSMYFAAFAAVRAYPHPV